MKPQIALSILLTATGLLAQGVSPTLPSAKNNSADPALTPPRVVMNPPEEYDSIHRKWQGIPSMERASNGRLWAVWYSGGVGEGPDNFLVLVTSRDSGKSWSKAQLVVTTAPSLGAVLREFDPGLWMDPAGRLWLFWAQSVAHWDGRGGVWGISTTNPDSATPTWSAPKRFADGIMLNKPIATSKTRWLLAIATWRNPPVKIRDSSIAASHLPREALAHDNSAPKGSRVYETTDGLNSLHLLGQAEVPDTWFDESILVERKDKTLWMLVRTTYGIGQATSADGGKTWTSGGDTNLSRVSARFFIRRLTSGDLLLVSNMPTTGTSRSMMTARISPDDGKTWSKGFLLDGRDLVSYPDGVQGKDGRIYVIYDHDRYGGGAILLATFTEEDVLAGHIISSNTTLKQVINALRPDSQPEIAHTK